METKEQILKKIASKVQLIKHPLPTDWQVNYVDGLRLVSSSYFTSLADEILKLISQLLKIAKQQEEVDGVSNDDLSYSHLFIEFENLAHSRSKEFEFLENKFREVLKRGASRKKKMEYQEDAFKLGQRVERDLISILHAARKIDS